MLKKLITPILLLALFTACAKPAQPVEPEPDPNLPQFDASGNLIQEELPPLTQPEIDTYEANVTAALTAVEADLSDENKAKLVQDLTDYGWALVNHQGNFDSGLRIYKLLFQYDKADSDIRKKLLRYLLTLNLDAIEKRNVAEADRMAQALFEFRPEEFYVQARMIKVASLKAELAFEQGNYEEALKWTSTSMTYHFDALALEKRVKIETDIAEIYLDQGKLTEVKNILDTVTYIVSLEGNETLLTAYRAKIDKIAERYNALTKKAG